MSDQRKLLKTANNQVYRVPVSKDFKGKFRTVKPGQEQIGIDIIPPLTANLVNYSSIGLPSLRGIADVPVEARSNFSWINPADIKKYKSNLNLPTDFMSPVFNQGLCGSCWAVATSGAFSDRWAISNRKSSPKFSTTYLLSCTIKDQDEKGIPISDREGVGCDGGIPSYAIDFINRIGITKESCWDYDWCLQNSGCFTTQSIGAGSSNLTNIIPKCLDYKSCVNSENGKVTREPIDRHYKCRKWSDVKQSQVPDSSYFAKIDDTTETNKPISTFGASKTFIPRKGYNDNEKIIYHRNVINDIKEEIYKRGPVVAGFRVIYPHFFGNNNLLVENTWIDDIYINPDSKIIEDLYQREQDTKGEIYYGGHAVVIVGWGEQELKFEKAPYFLKNDVKFPDEYLQYPYVKEFLRIKQLYNNLKGKKIQYWIIRNSWGTNVNNHTNGYYKMAISDLEMKIGTTTAIDVPLMLSYTYNNQTYEYPFGGVSVMLPEITEITEPVTSSDIVPVTNGTTIEPISYVEENNIVEEDIIKPKEEEEKIENKKETPTDKIIASGSSCGVPSLLGITSQDDSSGKSKTMTWVIIILIIIVILFFIFKNFKN